MLLVHGSSNSGYRSKAHHVDHAPPIIEAIWRRADPYEADSVDVLRLPKPQATNATNMPEMIVAEARGKDRNRVATLNHAAGPVVTASRKSIRRIGIVG